MRYIAEFQVNEVPNNRFYFISDERNVEFDSKYADHSDSSDSRTSDVKGKPQMNI